MSSSQAAYLPRAVENFPVLIVPGLRNSDKYHWQSLWQSRLPNSKRIHVDKWDVPDLDAWRAELRTALAPWRAQQLQWSAPTKSPLYF
jgi:uncharacterized protein